MTRLHRLLLGLFAILISIQASRPLADTRPNFVFILIDDLGWSDVGCYGSKFYETPSIDRFASTAMRFTNAYAACPVCSPTRASILTGKYPAKLHLTDYIPGEGNVRAGKMLIPKWTQMLPESEVTISRVLQQAGYATASIGKWHLGPKEATPDKYGFDVNIAGGAFGHPPDYFFPYGKPPQQLPHISQAGAKGEYLTDRLTDEAEKFLTSAKDKPFFLYFAHYAVHTPLLARPDLLAKYKAKQPIDEQKNAAYGAMVESVDQSVGRILKLLDDRKLADHTIVVFFSDNGGLWPQATSNRPLRAGKGFAYEGGIREPLLIRWPGNTKAGASSNTPIISMDFYPTMLEMAGLKGNAEHNKQVDGLSIVPLLKQTGEIQRDALYWHYPHYWRGGQSRPFGAVRSGDWKLIEYYEDMRAELYNLKDDIGESNDLAATNPQKAAELRGMLHAWRQRMDAQMPTPKPATTRPTTQPAATEPASVEDVWD